MGLWLPWVAGAEVRAAEELWQFAMWYHDCVWWDLALPGTQFSDALDAALAMVQERADALETLRAYRRGRAYAMYVLQQRGVVPSRELASQAAFRYWDRHAVYGADKLKTKRAFLAGVEEVVCDTALVSRLMTGAQQRGSASEQSSSAPAVED